MLGVAPEQRRQSRAQLPLTAKVLPCKRTGVPRIAYLRDINILGVFLYCDLDVRVGAELRVELAPTTAKPGLTVNCEAKVVRIERSAMNGLTGVALEFQGFVVEERSEHPQDDVTTPFVNWTVNMVEQKFARRRELQVHASRVQGAA
jgi:hypothetical protein